ncbi:hypothetical protein FPZ43_05325 [Mucilaginibacter pallidiroseus]|uniref:Uncharacterized protein n=1 Tax=Mucilaginibacter pallidiroseus TaxID=2599295 RepID=A0A563UG82_9SPHI|nr:hypothetical protein [Mucilaginibacter pallidiroseus]TWR30364.1 hypothetical protein FPZ43_05325 [Mucilaginibacter pallidiroseus]
MQRTLKFAIGTILLLFTVITNKAFSQSNIKLGDVSRFEFEIRGNGKQGTVKKYEAINEHSDWNCYQVALETIDAKGTKVTDNTRRLVKAIPPFIVNRLVKLSAKKDSGIDASLFRIQQPDMAKGLNAVSVKIAPDDKLQMLKLFKVDSLFNKALVKNVAGSSSDSKASHLLTIITKDQKTYTIEAGPASTPYALPWQIGNTKVYDPYLSSIFEFACGNEQYDRQQREILCTKIAASIYNDVIVPQKQTAGL